MQLNFKFLNRKLCRLRIAHGKLSKKNSLKSTDQFNLIKKLELNEDKINKLIKHCKMRKIEFLASIFDDWGLKFLVKKIKKIKIPSGEINNYPLLEEISKYNKE